MNATKERTPAMSLPCVKMHMVPTLASALTVTMVMVILVKTSTSVAKAKRMTVAKTAFAQTPLEDTRALATRAIVVILMTHV